MSIKINLTLCAMVAITTGCAGKLVVYDQNQNQVAGVPFRTAEVFVKEGTYTKHSKGGDCDPSPFVDTAALPVGDRFFVKAETAQFAKTAFHIRFAESGAVAEIGLDSEPSGAEVIKATTDLAKLVLLKPPAAAAPATTTTTADAAGSSRLAPKPPAQACDTGEGSVKFTRLTDYLARQGQQPVIVIRK